MDEKWLRDLLARATAAKPPIGPVARNALAAGIRLPRRRRIQGSAASVAAVAVVAAAVPLLNGVLGHTPPA